MELHVSHVLLEGEVDAFVLETFSDVHEIQATFRATRARRDLPVVAQMTVGADGSLSTKASQILMEAVSKMVDKAVTRVIEAKTLKLGMESASQPGVRGKDLVLWLLNHGHPNGGMGPPINAADLTKILSTIVFLE